MTNSLWLFRSSSRAFLDAAWKSRHADLFVLFGTAIGSWSPIPATSEQAADDLRQHRTRAGEVARMGGSCGELGGSWSGEAAQAARHQVSFEVSAWP